MSAVLEHQHQPRASTSSPQTTSRTGSHRRSGSASSSKNANMSSTRTRGTMGTAGRPPHHRHALSAIRAFLRRESCFDILPESFRLIVFDNKLLIKRALVALQTNGEARFAKSPFETRHTDRRASCAICLGNTRRRICTTVRLCQLSLRRNVHPGRRHSPDSVLLPVSDRLRFSGDGSRIRRPLSLKRYDPFLQLN